MARLIAKPALPAGELLSLGGVTVRSTELGPVTHIAPFAGTRGEVSEGLSALGLEWPEPGGTKTSDIARILWAGRNAALLIGAAPPVGLETSAALSDQIGANAAVRISGAGAEEVLARLGYWTEPTGQFYSVEAVTRMQKAMAACVKTKKKSR